MKGIKQVLCMLLGVVAFIGLTSCEEDIVKYHEEKEISRETEKDGINGSSRKHGAYVKLGN